jgi:hypothetical protein
LQGPSSTGSAPSLPARPGAANDAIQRAIMTEALTKDAVNHEWLILAQAIRIEE